MRLQPRPQAAAARSGSVDPPPPLEPAAALVQQAFLQSISDKCTKPTRPVLNCERRSLPASCFKQQEGARSCP